MADKNFTQDTAPVGYIYVGLVLAVILSIVFFG